MLPGASMVSAVPAAHHLWDRGRACQRYERGEHGSWQEGPGAEKTAVSGLWFGNADHSRK